MHSDLRRIVFVILAKAFSMDVSAMFNLTDLLVASFFAGTGTASRVGTSYPAQGYESRDRVQITMGTPMKQSRFMQYGTTGEDSPKLDCCCNCHTWTLHSALFLLL